MEFFKYFLLKLSKFVYVYAIRYVQTKSCVCNISYTVCLSVHLFFVLDFSIYFLYGPYSSEVITNSSVYVWTYSIVKMVYTTVSGKSSVNLNHPLPWNCWHKIYIKTENSNIKGHNKIPQLKLHVVKQIEKIIVNFYIKF